MKIIIAVIITVALLFGGGVLALTDLSQQFPHAKEIGQGLFSGPFVLGSLVFLLQITSRRDDDYEGLHVWHIAVALSALYPIALLTPHYANLMAEHFVQTGVSIFSTWLFYLTWRLSIKDKNRQGNGVDDDEDRIGI